MGKHMNQGRPRSESQDLARKELQQKYDLYKFDLAVPTYRYCPIVTQTEKQYAMEKYDKIEKSRVIEN